MVDRFLHLLAAKIAAAEEHLLKGGINLVDLAHVPQKNDIYLRQNLNFPRSAFFLLRLFRVVMDEGFLIFRLDSAW